MFVFAVFFSVLVCVVVFTVCCLGGCVCACLLCLVGGGCRVCCCVSVREFTCAVLFCGRVVLLFWFALFSLSCLQYVLVFVDVFLFGGVISLMCAVAFCVCSFLFVSPVYVCVCSFFCFWGVCLLLVRILRFFWCAVVASVWCLTMV